MKREILFRAKGSGNWRYGSYVHFDKKPINDCCNNKYKDFIVTNGVYGEHYYPECTHREYRRKITDVFTTYGWIFKRADGFTIAIDDEILQGELIGNVTDNPELMK